MSTLRAGSAILTALLLGTAFPADALSPSDVNTDCDDCTLTIFVPATAAEAMDTDSCRAAFLESLLEAEPTWTCEVPGMWTTSDNLALLSGASGPEPGECVTIDVNAEVPVWFKLSDCRDVDIGIVDLPLSSLM